MAPKAESDARTRQRSKSPLDQVSEKVGRLNRAPSGFCEKTLRRALWLAGEGMSTGRRRPKLSSGGTSEPSLFGESRSVKIQRVQNHGDIFGCREHPTHSGSPECRRNRKEEAEA